MAQESEPFYYSDYYYKDRMTDEELLSYAQDYYKGVGFQVVLAVPTLVDIEVALTTTTQDRLLRVLGKTLVGSAEQSFLQMIADGQFENGGRWQAITDCFRPQDVGVSHYHRNYFKKLELISIDPGEYELDSLVSCAMSLVQRLRPEDNLALVETEDGFDIELNGIEVGSYGTRRFLDREYVYGTGLALPRFRMA